MPPSRRPLSASRIEIRSGREDEELLGVARPLERSRRPGRLRRPQLPALREEQRVDEPARVGVREDEPEAGPPGGDLGGRPFAGRRVAGAVARDHAQTVTAQIGDSRVCSGAAPAGEPDAGAGERPAHVTLGIEGRELVARGGDDEAAKGRPRCLLVGPEQPA